MVGGGASIAEGPEKSWSVAFTIPGKGWIGIVPDATANAVASSAGVALDATAGEGACDVFLQLIESDGESFVAPISLANRAGRRIYNVRWRDFVRDQRQRPGAANDGFAHAGLQFLALSVRSGVTRGLLLHRIALIPMDGR
jgi:hypothetical protein